MLTALENHRKSILKKVEIIAKNPKSEEAYLNYKLPSQRANIALPNSSNHDSSMSYK